LPVIALLEGGEVMVEQMAVAAGHTIQQQLAQ